MTVINFNFAFVKKRTICSNEDFNEPNLILKLIRSVTYLLFPSGFVVFFLYFFTRLIHFFHLCRYPFNDSEHASLFAKISRGYFVVPECLSSRGKCLIRSLLRREACERLSARDVLRHPWLARDPRNELPPRAASSHDRLVPDITMDDDV